MKNYAVEFYRFLFAMIICMAHFSGRCDAYAGRNLFIDGDGVVEFFFILSGFFLMKKYYSRIERMESDNTINSGEGVLTVSCAAEESFRFLKGKIQRLYPHYLFSFAVILLWKIYERKEVWTTLKNGFFEAFMLHRVGIPWESYNNPTWYVCTMLVAGYFIMFLLMKNHKLFSYILAPAGILLGYGYMAEEFNGIIGITTMAAGCIPVGILRAGTDILLGCLTYELYLKVYPCCKEKFKLAGTVIELVLYGIIVSYMKWGGEDFDDFIIVVLMAVAILMTYMGNSYLSKLLNNKLSMKAGTLSYAIYLNHWVFIKIFGTFSVFNQRSFAVQLVMYVTIVIGYSVLSVSLVEWIQKKLEQRLSEVKG